MPDPRYDKEHNQPFLSKKNKKLVKKSKVIFHQPKAIQSPNVVDIKSVTIHHPKASQEDPKTIQDYKAESKYF